MPWKWMSLPERTSSTSPACTPVFSMRKRTTVAPRLRTPDSEVVGVKGASVKLPVGPAEDAYLGGAERFEPAAGQVDFALAPRGNLLGLGDDRTPLVGPQAVGFG